MPKITPKHVIIVSLVFVVIFILFSSFYTVDKDQKVVVLQFDKYIRTVGPGLNFKMPFGIEQVYKVPVEKVLTEQFGFQTKNVTDSKSEFIRGNYEKQEAQMLTADLKVVQVEWIVQYKISDPKNFLFKVKDPVYSLRKFSKIAMSQITGDYFFDEIITIAKNEITNKVLEKLQEIINQLEMGNNNYSTVALTNVTPTDEVTVAYNEVLQAQQEKDKIVNEAKTVYIQTVTPAEEQASKLIAEAKGYKADRVGVAQGEAAYFNSLFKEFAKAPDITKYRMYLETFGEILPKFEKVYILDDKEKNLLPFLQLDSKKQQQQQGGSNE